MKSNGRTIVETLREVLSKLPISQLPGILVYKTWYMYKRMLMVSTFFVWSNTEISNLNIHDL